MIQTTITITVHHTKPIPDLTDKVAGRIYTMDLVEDVTVQSEIHPLQEFFVIPEESGDKNG